MKIQEKKDAEIIKLKKRIEELESNKNDEDLILDEINQVLRKFEKGFYGIYAKKTIHQIKKINQIRDNLNNALQSNAELANRGIATLIEYGNANFEYQVDTDGLSGKMGSIILGVRALGSSISELLAILDTTSETLHNEMIDLSDAANSLATASNQQASSLEETAAALEQVTSTVINTSENTYKMAKLSEEVNKSVKKW